MGDVVDFGWIVLAVSLAFLVAVMSSRLSARLRIPAPAIFLIGAAAASNLVSSLAHIPVHTVERVVTVALVIILFDGGMHIGWARFRSAAGAVVWLGVAGTFVTAAGIAIVAHLIFRLGWQESLLLGTALAPTDPAVVFSVLGGREVGGRAGVLLEGESGANDPVGIALMVALLGAHTMTGGAAFLNGLREFVLQLVVGAAVGIAAGLGLRWLLARTPAERGPVCIAGDCLRARGVRAGHGRPRLRIPRRPDRRASCSATRLLPFRAEIRSFSGSLASLAEIIAFVVLGLTVDIREIGRRDAWAIGLVLAVLLAFVIRPVLGGLVLWPVKLSRGERLFVLWSGLKGAVPILLGLLVVAEGMDRSAQIYAVVFIVVAFSVIVQGGLVPTVASRLGVPLTEIPEND